MTWRESPRIMRFGPVNVVLVELDGLGVGLLRVSEEVALHVLAGNDPENGLGGNPFAYVKSNRFDFEPGLFAFPAPFEPGLVSAERGGERAGFLVGQRAFTGCAEQLGKLVGFGGF